MGELAMDRDLGKETPGTGRTGCLKTWPTKGQVPRMLIEKTGAALGSAGPEEIKVKDKQG
jgi:hypothetical protein